ncbi:MAG: hypothetical protein COA79_05420 [Planctomycetota bacterium]|nr:MAG: hypothetical protein COA79_05420 [Planctomycetota bacterium]
MKKLAYCVGEISDEIIEAFHSYEINIKKFLTIEPCLTSLDEFSSYFILIHESFLNDGFQIDQIKEMPVVVYTDNPINVDGYAYIREGAIDYLSVDEKDFVWLIDQSVKKYVKKHAKGFLHKFLMDSESLYYSIIDESPNLILICNVEGQLIISNKLSSDSLGLKDGENKIHDYLDSVLCEEFIETIKVTLTENKSYKMKCSLSEKSLKKFPVSWIFCPFDHVLANTVLIYGQNITDLEEVRKKDFYKTKSLLSLNDKLEGMNKSLDQFSGMISHDLKNGLNRILGFIRIIDRNESSHLSEEGKELIQKVNSSADDMVLTIDRILDFARSKGTDLQLRNIKISELILKVLNSFQYKFEEIQGMYHLEKNDIMISVDMIMMKQIFENLVSNAIKYRSSKRDLLLSVTIEDVGSDICICFEDNGSGVKEEDTDVLFEPYFRNSKHEESVEGHGIGLSTVKTLIEAHGGIIWVESDIERGSSFNIQLPKSN